MGISTPMDMLEQHALLLLNGKIERMSWTHSLYLQACIVFTLTL